MQKNKYISDRSTKIRSIFVLVVSGLMVAGITYLLYSYTQNLLIERLKERIIAIASTAATQISPDEVSKIISSKDTGTSAARHIAHQLSQFRDANEDIRFAYILARSKQSRDPNELEFVMDAESLDTKEQQEKRNGKALSDDELAPQPGDPFNAKDYPALRDEAFYHPTSETQLQTDKWSSELSAYAPILNKDGSTIAILGVDVIADNFLSRTSTTFLPFILFIAFLILLLSLLTVLLIRFWNERMQILQDLDRQKDELLGIVSHQLAKPITAIKWTLESLADGDTGALTKDQKDSVETMQTMAVDLADLVGMILDVSRIQLGRVKLDPQPLDLNTFFKEVVSVIQPAANQKNLTLDLQIPENLPTVLLDKRYTRMTIENLLTNAVKYTPERGRVSLSIAIDGGNLRCHVTDTGCGIPKAEQGKIFEKMFRASNARNAVEGNGFGLYVAKGAVEAQGGTIGFTSVEQKGTTFSVTLPIRSVTITSSPGGSAGSH
jgi:signal transduction histidine kinase